MILLIGVATALSGQQSTTTPGPVTPAPQTEDRRRELNLLGKEDITAGESRRNENIQFNAVDNNALKELNVRLGVSATLITEFQPDRSYFGAEFGLSPAATVHLTRTAREGWHGSLFYNHLNSVTSARSFFQVGGVKPARENRYGATTGLSPWRRAFVSFRFGQERLQGQVNGNVLVPLPGERTPLTTDPARREVIARFLAAYPTELPNRTDINARALNTNAPQRILNNEASATFEQDLGRQDRLLMSYGTLSQNVEAFQLVAGQNPDTLTRSHRARLTWIRQFDAATLLTVSTGFDRVGSLLVPDEGAVGPMVSTTGLTTLGPLATIPIDRAQNSWRQEAQLGRTSGAHSWKAGVQLTRRHLNGSETDGHRGVFTFSNDFGRTGIENLRSGVPSQYIIAIGDIHRGYRQWVTSLYGADQWRVGSRLSLSAGVRYDLVARPAEVNGLERIAYDCDCNNIAPRLGAALRLPERWGVVRAAAGIHFGDIFPVTYSQVRFSPPGSVKFAIPAPDLLYPVDPSQARGNLYLLDPELASPYSYQYNFSWQPDLWKALKLELGYVSSRSHKLLIMWYLNRAHPVEGIPQTTATINQRRQRADLAEIRWVLNGSRGYFDAARATLIAPRVGGFSIDASYWWSKAIDMGADHTNTAYDADSRLSRSQWEFETHKDRKALSVFDQPHSFLFRGAWQRGGWSVNGILLLKQGTPFTVTTLDGPGFGNVDGNGNDRPNLLDASILGRKIGNPDTSVALLPRSAFVTIAPATHGGNLGVNTFRRGGIRNLNASVARSFAYAKARITVRAESINLMNTPQFAEPGAVFGTPEFGFITNTLNDGRTFRLSLTLGW